MDKQYKRVISPTALFYSYAHEDEWLRNELEKHLRLLSRQGLISEWHDRQIIAGTEWAREIDKHLETASIILLLVSADFLASDYCYDIEMERALERHERGEAHVIPIIVRPVDWHDAPFAHLHCLPSDGKPITEWDNQDAAFREITRGIRQILEQRAPSAHPTPRASPIDRQNRLRLLKRIRVFWIEGVLEQSLYKAARIEIGLREQPDALANPWRLTIQEANQAPRLVAANTPLVEIYDEADGELLILGEPGAGKTTLLLELTRDLIARAEQNDILSMPVVFNLSSWAEKQHPLARWLIEELESKYQVPRNLGRAWMAQERILPLLDGLDEVKQEVRSACIDAVNAYRVQHQQAPPVVCSRSAEYFTQQQRLTFLRALTIQPLTAQQIDAYLTNAGGQLKAVREAVRTNTVLYDLVTTPLLLNILVLAYQGRSLDDLQRVDSREAQRQLFATYIQRMLKRRSSDPRFPEQQTIQWLSWLAQQMARHGQSTFFIERMQPTWLSGHLARWAYRIIVGLIVVLLYVLVELLLGLSFVMSLGWSDIFYVILLIGLIVGFIVGCISIFRTEIKPAERVTWSRKKAMRGCGSGLGIGLLITLSLALLTVQSCTVTGTSGTTTLNMSACSPSDSGFFILLLVYLFLGLFSMLLTWTAFGISGKVLEENMFMKPNEGIQISVRNSIRYGIYTMFIVGLTIMLSVGLFQMAYDTSSLRPLPAVTLAKLQSWLFTGTPIGLIIGVSVGLLVGLSIGGLACIRHVILRLLLWRSMSIPRNYPQFLDYAAERILLRKVGGGYIFIHRLLLDYFASLELSSSEGAFAVSDSRQKPDKKE